VDVDADVGVNAGVDADTDAAELAARVLWFPTQVLTTYGGAFIHILMTY
jgi:hypothetical protein